MRDSVMNQSMQYVGTLASVFAYAALVACSSPTPTGPNLTPTDAGGTPDSATLLDAAALDAATIEAGPPGEILGTLSGSCGLVRPEIARAAPSLLQDKLVFVAGEQYSKDFLSAGGDTLFDTPNAGGSSGESEVMSFEVLHSCEGARLLKTETQIGYAAPVAGQANSITDLMVEINGQKVGVSVTRAYKPTNQGPQTDAELTAVLTKKLEGITVSSARVLPADKWVKQILHVFAASAASAQAVERIVTQLPAATRRDTIVLVTQTVGGGFIYCNPDPALGQECP